ncbi:hypothetical protein LTR08_002948 [Meristemomyces frigidus]|nr:hypothetical protein LTR08_002948 [Meristemomyces frigidus]
MASYIPDLARTNISFYTVPAAWIVALMPRVWALNNYKAATKKDTKAIALQPRDFSKIATNDQALDAKTRDRIIRAEAAQANGFENFGLFAAAVVAGNMAGLEVSTMNGLTIAYVVSRVVYNHIYIYNDLLPSQARTAAFFGGVGICMAMFVQAGNKMRSTLL